MQETQVRSLGWGDPLEKGMATHSVLLPGESHGQGAWMATGLRDQHSDMHFPQPVKLTRQIKPQAILFPWARGIQFYKVFCYNRVIAN